MRQLVIFVLSCAAGASIAASAQAVTIDFEQVPDGDLASYVEFGVTFTAYPAGLLTANGFLSTP